MSGSSAVRANPLRRLYDWVLSWADRPNGSWALFLLAFAESSFFPVPPDVLLIALVMARREAAWKFATLCTVGSVLGGMAGYAIGWGAWEATHSFWFRYVFSEAKFNQVRNLYHQYDLLLVLAAAFTPIPYKICTIAAGVVELSFVPFVLASIVGRGARFYLVAGIMRWIGPSAKPFIDKWFNWLALAFFVLLVLGFWILGKL